MRHFTVVIASFIFAASFLACSGADEIEDHPCPSTPAGGTALTYENFGRAFIDAHCIICHGGANAHSSRAFTSVDQIRAQRDRIFANAAAGNRSMPPGPDGPSPEDRNRLADWLACGAP